MRLKLSVLALVLLPFKQPKLLPGMSQVSANMRTLLALARTSSELDRRRWLNGLLLIEYSKLVKEEASPAFA
jgi:hypothetical protein